MDVNLPDLSGKALELIQGEEKRLRLRQRHARFGILAALGGIALQVGYAAVGKPDLKKLGDFLTNLLRLDFSQLWQNGVPVPELVAAIAIFGGLATYVLLRWTGFLLRESREPFRYTFQIQAFERVADTPPVERFVLKNEDRFKLLSHDLMERLNQRIKRLSILDEKAQEKAAEGSLGSHIDIRGHYAIREEVNGRWIIEVMPRVRIGPVDRPATLAPPVKYPLQHREEHKEPPTYDLHADTYNQIVERVHSAVATEVYRQIETDVRNKIVVFPTAYLRAVALGHEAEDFARSNTVDAYDRAIDLYRQALHYFAIAEVRPITRFLLRWPLLWRKDVRFVHTRARVIIGYSKALIYRRKLSALTGRYLNPLFEIPPLLEQVIANLRTIQGRVTGFDVTGRSNANRAFLTFPEDNWWRYVTRRPDKRLFEAQRHVLFDALVAVALAYYYLDAVNKASEYLEDARAVDPQRSQQDALFLLTEAEIEPALHKEIILFQKAAEVAPDFQIANYLYAYHSEMLFRARDELTVERASRVIDAYDDVLLRINPGNIAALAAQGYLRWLLGGNDEAFRKFDQGRELKSIIRETFVGVLNYGLARIAAEKGRFNECYDRYMEAVSADPGVAAYSTDARGRTNGAYYEYITPEILGRYRDYQATVLRLLTEVAASGKDADHESCSARTRETVRSFALNDYANARFNYYMRMGDDSELQGALVTYQEAIDADPTNATAYYNLASAQMLKGSENDAVVANFGKAESRAPTWPTVLTATAKAAMEAINRAIAAKEKERSDAEARHADELLHATQERKRKDRKSGAEWPLESGSSEPDKRPAPAPAPVADALARLLEEQKKELALIDSAIAQQRKRINTDVADRLARAFERTRFGPLLAGSGVDEEPVNRLLAMRIERSRIDENDIETLRLLAAVLSKNSERPTTAGEDQDTRKIRRASERLCQFLSEYYPEDFDRNLLMYAMYDAGKSEAAAETRKVIKAQVKRWLDMDPVNYLALTWLPDARAAFDLPEVDQLVKSAIDVAPANATPYRVLAGDSYYLADRLEDAIREYRAAVTPSVKNPDHANRLANTYYRRGGYADAVEWYEAAIRLSPKDAVYHANLGGALRQLDDWARAAAAYTSARELEPNNEIHRRNLRTVYNEWGNELSFTDQNKEAVEKYRAAIAALPGDAVIHSNLSSSLAALREPGHDQQNLDGAIAELETALELSRDTTEYSRRLHGLQVTKRVVSRFGPHVMDRFPVVTPIAIEVANDLVPFLAGEKPGNLSPLASELTNVMRERLQKDMGVRVPGLRYRGSDDLPDGTYILMLNEVPLVSGNVAIDQRLTTLPRNRLVELSIPVEETLRPDTGEDGFWVPEPHWPAVVSAGGELWEVIEYPIRHLERLVHRNLSMFLGHQEVTSLLQDNGGAAAQAILQDGARLTALTVTLRSLLNEEVPIVELAAILDRFVAVSAKDATLRYVVQQLRLVPQLRARLPGTQDTTKQLRLGQKLEGRIAQAVARDNGRSVLALEPDACQDVLAAVREQTGRALGGEREALVVRDISLRPFVRKLVELEFPDLSVLAAEELQEGVVVAGLPEVELA